MALDDPQRLSLNSGRSGHTGASVALLVVLSALTLAPFDRFGRYFTVAFLVSLLAIWAGAVFTIYLIKHTIV